MSLRDKIRYWEEHRSNCTAVNCIATVVSVADVIFLKDYPELNDQSTISFYHKFTYMTNVTEKLNCFDKRVEFTYLHGCLCVTVKCDCTEEFSLKCLMLNFGLLCKAVMLALDGTYPFSTSVSPISSDKLPFCSEENEENEKKEEEEDGFQLDVFNRRFCSLCFTPILFCSCITDALSQTEFLDQLQCYNLCAACNNFSPECECNFKIYELYQYYSKFIVNGKICKRMNEVRRLAYLSSCNIKICLNCNRAAFYCICDMVYKKYFPFL